MDDMPASKEQQELLKKLEKEKKQLEKMEKEVVDDIELEENSLYRPKLNFIARIVYLLLNFERRYSKHEFD